MTNDDKLQSLTILKKLVECQHAGPPYRGWNIRGLTDLHNEHAKQFDELGDNGDTVYLICYRFFACRQNYVVTGRSVKSWSVTDLNKVAEWARSYLNLPSIETLNPDIQKMREAAVRNRLLGKPLEFGTNESEALLAHTTAPFATPDGLATLRYLKGLDPEDRNTLIESVSLEGS